MHNELLPWLEQKALEVAILYAKEYDRYDRGQCHAYCEAIAKLTAESHHRVMERICVKAEGISEEEGMYCTPYDPETDTEPTETRTEYCYRMGLDM
tara:strand:- start:467 stop:754 length:288 start_codon:yes stop_codon:yes gene_type:complete